MLYLLARRLQSPSQRLLTSLKGTRWMKNIPPNADTDIAPSKGLSRRTFTKGLAATAAVGLGTFSFFHRTPVAADKSLRILSWAGYDETDVIGEFEDTHKVKVDFKLFVGDEQMLQFFNQTPPGTFDAIIADVEYVNKLVASNAIDPIAMADIPEFVNYHPAFRDEPALSAGDGMVYGVATRFSFYGISYNADELSAEQATDWHSLLAPELTGKVGVFDWYLPNLGNAVLAVSPNNPSPYDVSDEILAQARDWLMRLRPQVALFAPSPQLVVQGMISGDILAAPMGDLDIDLKMSGYDNFSSTIPNQGGIRWQEVATLCSASQNKDLALEWVKYMSTPKVQSKLVYTKAFKARAPNLKVVDYWDDEQKSTLGYVPDPADPSKLAVEALIARSVARGLPTQQPEQDWISIFNEFKNA
jgi:spermidine/putrescine transport system substrate-binding protein